MDDKRLIDLEIRFMQQDEYLRQLNEVVLGQAEVIRRLEKDIYDLKRNVNAGTETRNLSDEKPPHY
jgi:uncharacterized coiled-coil protein SlyX